MAFRSIFPILPGNISEPTYGKIRSAVAQLRPRVVTHHHPGDLWTLHVISSSDELKVTGHDITSQSRVSWEGRRALCRYQVERKRKHLAVQVAPTLIVLQWKSHAWLILPCSTVPGPWFLRIDNYLDTKSLQIHTKPCFLKFEGKWLIFP